jgi:TP901 family phage tail tape measure protein
MAVDVAKLKVVVDTSSVKAGKEALEDFSGSGAGAEKAVESFGTASKGASVKVSTLVKGISGLASAVGAMALAHQFTTQGRAVSKALAEVSTLIDGTDQQLADLTSASQKFTSQFGGSVESQLSGFYQTISAGAGSVAEATETMDAANKLALGGVTDITTAVDGLTTILNAYGGEAGSATDVSDAMFVAMKAGKTTIGELSSSIGAVAPLAESAGVSIEELLSATAALTKGGMSTSVSMSGLRAMLAAVTKPSSEASKLAKQLGIDFSASALKSKGFTGFLDDLVKKTGGSSDAMATLFGGVEAIVPALALAGAAGQDYSDIMADMATKSGATDDAVQKFANSLDQRLSAALGRFNVYGEQAGGVLLSVIVPALESFNSAVDFAVAHSDEISAAMIGLAATQIPALVTGLAGLTTGMGLAATAARAMGVAMAFAGGPIGIAVGLVAGAAAYFPLFRDNAKEAEQGVYDAAAGTSALNAALGVFYNTAAPSAGKSAIDLANDNYKLAKSALDAADAELAKVQALNNGSGPSGLWNDDAAQPWGEAATEAKARVAEARAAVDQARSDQLRAANAVTGSMYTTNNIPKIPEIKIPPLSADTGSSGKTATDVDKIADAYDSLKSSLDPAYASQQQFNAGLATLDAALDAGKIGYSEYADTLDQLKEKYSNVSEYATQGADAISSIFMAATDGADSALEAVSSLLMKIAEAQLTSAFQDASGSSGLFGMIGSLLNPTSAVANAKGGVYSSQSLSAYSGSVVSKPTTFAFANGAGLMGEAGPEAIMPLSRGSDGKLGVATSGGNSGGTNMNVTVNNTNGDNQVSTRKQSGPSGDEIVIDIVKKATGAGKFDQSQKRYGNTVTPVRRG